MNTGKKRDDDDEPKKGKSVPETTEGEEPVNPHTPANPYPTGSPPDPEEYHKKYFPDRYPEEVPPEPEPETAKKRK